jgi:mannosyltransferase
MAAISKPYNKLIVDQNLMSNVLLGIVVMVGAVLRFYHLGAESYWFDEIITVSVDQGKAEPLRAGLWTSWYVAPTYRVLIHFWIKAFGTTEAATRSLSALCGIASIVLMYVVGRRMFGKRVGLLSALLMAISGFQLYYSQEARFYTLFQLTTLLSFIFLIEFLKSTSRLYFVLYVSSTILLLYSHLYGVFVLAAQNLYFLLSWHRFRNTRIAWFLSQVLVFLSLLPAALPFMVKWVQKGAGGTDWIPDSPLWYPLKTLYRFVFPFRHQRSWPSLYLNFGTGIAFLIFGTLVFAVTKRKERWVASVKNLVPSIQALSSKKNEIFLLGCWFICPIVIPFILSMVLRPMYVDRYMISAAPAFYLLLALGITTVRRVVPEFLFMIAIVIIIVPGLQHYYVRDVKEQWREVARYVEGKGGQGDVVVFAPSEEGVQQKAFDWYYRASLPRCGLEPQFCKDSEAIADALARCTTGHERFWLIMNGSPRNVERFRAFFLNCVHADMTLIREERFPGIPVYLFKLTKQR